MKTMTQFLKFFIVVFISNTTYIPLSLAGQATQITTGPLDELKWQKTPFGPLASSVSGDFSSTGHTTYIKFPAGMVTPIHTHTHDYVGIVLSGTTMHWEPGKPETQVRLPVGSHWTVPAGVTHVSECLHGEECIMAISQTEAFDFIPVKNSELTDSSIVAIYNQVNGFDIEIGKLAHEKGHSPQVRELGKMVMNDHQAVKQSTVDVAIAQGVRPVLPIERAKAITEHKITYDQLSELSGEKFDKAYLLHEIDFHTNAINAVETTLIPGTKNPKLKNLMEEILPGFKHHLAETKRIAVKLGYL